MGKRDPRIDAYIEKSADFAKPVLRYFREVVHAAVPDVEEMIRWSAPSFDYKGPMCNMAAFKAYLGVHFWKAPLLGAPEFGQITSIDDLPPKKELIQLLKKAARLNHEGAKVPKRPGVH